MIAVQHPVVGLWWNVPEFFDYCDWWAAYGWFHGVLIGVLLVIPFAMSKGRRPKPVASVPAILPDRPLWLDGLAADEWDRVAPHVLGTVTEVDQTVFAVYCQTYARWREAEKELNDGGLVLSSGKPNPAARQSDALLKQLRGLLAELGLTPASRGRLLQGPPQNEEEKKLDALLAG